MKLFTHSNDYLSVALRMNGVQKRINVHKLVAEAFIPNPENLPCIDHINTIRTDNRVENLRWVTHKENMNNPITKQKMIESGRKKVFTDEHKKKISEALKGENAPLYGKNHTEESKKKMSEAKKGKYIGSKNPRAKRVYCNKIVYGSILECAEFYDVKQKNMSNWLNGRYNMPQKFKDLGLRWATEEDINMYQIYNENIKQGE